MLISINTYYLYINSQIKYLDQTPVKAVYNTIDIFQITGKELIKKLYDHAESIYRIKIGMV